MTKHFFKGNFSFTNKCLLSPNRDIANKQKAKSTVILGNNLTFIPKKSLKGINNNTPFLKSYKVNRITIDLTFLLNYALIFMKTLDSLLKKV